MSAEARSPGRAAVQAVIVRVGDDSLIALLADQRQIVFPVDINDFLVSAVADVDCARRGVPGGHVIQCALDSAEIAAAVGGDDEIGRDCGTVGLGGELPDIGGANAGECRADTVHESSAQDIVNQHVVGLVVGQDA